MENYTGLILPIAFLAIFYFLVIRPQRKKDKQIKEMRNGLKVGEEIITIGGIVGKIVKTGDDQITIEVGSEKNKIKVAKWAIGSVTKTKN